MLRPRRTARCARLRTAASRRLLTVSLQARGHSPGLQCRPTGIKNWPGAVGKFFLRSEGGVLFVRGTPEGGPRPSRPPGKGMAGGESSARRISHEASDGHVAAWVADSAAAGLISPWWLLLYSPVTLSVLLHHDRWVGTAIGGEPSPEGGLQGSRCFLLSK